MTNEQTAAFVFAASIRAFIKAQGMITLNIERQTLGQSIAYDEEAFVSLIYSEGIDNNSVISLFHNIVGEY